MLMPETTANTNRFFCILHSLKTIETAFAGDLPTPGLRYPMARPAAKKNEALD